MTNSHLREEAEGKKMGGDLSDAKEDRNARLTAVSRRNRGEKRE